METDPPHETFEYRVVPAPRKGEKARGVRSGEARFALAMTRLMNRMGQDGWEFVRADTLPAEERVGLTGTEVRYHTLLVFRRAKAPPPVQQVIAPPPEPLRLAAPMEWPGFDEAAAPTGEIEDAQVMRLLSDRRGERLAAE